MKLTKEKQQQILQDLQLMSADKKNTYLQELMLQYNIEKKSYNRYHDWGLEVHRSGLEKAQRCDLYEAIDYYARTLSIPCRTTGEPVIKLDLDLKTATPVEVMQKQIFLSVKKFIDIDLEKYVKKTIAQKTKVPVAKQTDTND